MRWHWQNQNTHKGTNKPKGSGFWNGRAWFYLTERLTFEPSWSFGRYAGFTFLELSKSCGDGNDLTFKIGIRRVFSLFLTIGGLPFVRSRDIYDEERQIGVTFHHSTIWIYFWGDPTGWGPDRYWSFSVDRFVFGYPTYSEENATEPQRIAIHMPEGDYTAVVEFHDAVWRYKRFRKPKLVHRADIVFDENNLIKFAGKGENSWDLDDDAIWEMTMSDVHTIEDVKKRLYEHIMKRRKKYGLPDDMTDQERLLNENAMKLL